jgi:hypothetical protein
MRPSLPIQQNVSQPTLKTHTGRTETLKTCSVSILYRHLKILGTLTRFPLCNTALKGYRSIVLCAVEDFSFQPDGKKKKG